MVATGKLTTYPGRSRYQIVDRAARAGRPGRADGPARQAPPGARRRRACSTPARKRPLPFAPRVIGVVTSPTGAVIRDILHRLEDRFPCHVIVWPVPVQGEGAAAQIAAAVRGFNALAPAGRSPRPDLLIVARGGGSIEDLWAFNEEEVVRAVAGSRDPDHLGGRPRDRHLAVRFRRRRARADADRRRRDGGAGARRAARPGARARRAGPSAAPAARSSAPAEQLAGLPAPLARARGPARAAAAAARRARRAAAARARAAGSTAPAASSAMPPARCGPACSSPPIAAARERLDALVAGRPARPSQPAARARLCPGRGPRRPDPDLGGGGARGAAAAAASSATARSRPAVGDARLSAAPRRPMPSRQGRAAQVAVKGLVPAC